MGSIPVFPVVKFIVIQELLLFHTDAGKAVSFGPTYPIIYGLTYYSYTPNLTVPTHLGTATFKMPLLDNEPVITKIWIMHFNIVGLEFEFFAKSTYRIKDIIADIIHARESNFLGIITRRR